MWKRLDIKPGDRFGRLTIISESEATYWGKYRKRQFLCECQCGNKTIAQLSNLTNGHTSSCGCNLKSISATVRKTHGCSGTRLHGIWAGMLNRCRNKNVKSYRHYGAKGVSVCKEWLSFKPFMEWAISNGYRDDLTIDRKDPYGNYEPGNCRWATRLEQGQNRRHPAKTAI